MTIYFGHEKRSYDTEYELLCIERIKELHPLEEIVNPKDIEIPDKNKSPSGYTEFLEQMKYYLSVLSSCNLLVVAKTRTGKISAGVRKEIDYATRSGIPIEYLNIIWPVDNRPTLTCHFCNTQFVVNDEDIAEEGDRTKWCRAATSEYSLKNEDETWVDSCPACNGTDPCFGCGQTDLCSKSGMENVDKNKCQVARMQLDFTENDNACQFTIK